MSGGDHGVSSENRQRTAADPIRKLRCDAMKSSVDDNRHLELNALGCS